MKPRPLEWREVVVEPATPLEQIAEQFAITVDAIRALNPHFRIHRTPNDRAYAVRIPVSATGPAGGAGIVAD
jgi:hypothetical protein